MGDEQASLRDTTPGIPEMELSKTLPTGAAFHATWRIPNLAAAQTADATQESGVHAVDRPQIETQDTHADRLTSAMPNTPASSPSAPEAVFGTTRKGYAPGPGLETAPPKLTTRERAKRNVLTHTLQMPLVVTPLPPRAADSDSQASPRATQRGGTGAPQGWTSVQRVGSGAPPEPSRERPQPRATDPMLNRTRAEFRAQPSMHEPPPLRPPHSSFQDPPSFSHRPPSASYDPHSYQPRWASQVRAGDYDRVTLPEGAPRIPELSGREWLFIGLLVCASAATLYSLVIDDIAPAVEEDLEAATTVEHLLQPAPSIPPPASQYKGVGQGTAPAAATSITEIVTEPSSAEIVVGGAVIGNTPAHVVRGPDADYLLRKQGYEPQLVRVTANSPDQIVITLHPK